jgi:hypothetical protein
MRQDLSSEDASWRRHLHADPQPSRRSVIRVALPELT